MEFIENDDLFQVRKLDSYMEGHAGYIAGGVFKNVFQREAFKDIDIFFKNQEDFNKALDLFTKNESFVKLYDNKNAICFKKKDKRVRVDLVKSDFKEPLDMIKSFDFTIAKFAYFKEPETGTYKCVYHPKFFEHLNLKRLVIDDTMRFPVGTFERSYRYKGYGYGLCRESKAKIIQALQGADVTNLAVDLYFGLD